MKRALLAASLVGFVSLVPLTSFASPCSSPSTPGCICKNTQTSPTWNVPAGAAVFSRSSGILEPMFNALGEYRTHTMMSMGPNTWALHNTSSPESALGNLGVCSTPLNGPSMFQPGLRMVTPSQMFGYIGDPFAPSNNVEYLAYQTVYPGSWGESWVNGSTFGNQLFLVTRSMLGPFDSNAGNFPVFFNGSPITYDFHTFVAGTLMGSGDPSPSPNNQFSFDNGQDPGNGMVCSSSAAFMQARVLTDNNNTLNLYPGGWVEPKTYKHHLLYEGGGLAENTPADNGVANTLWGSTYEYCEQNGGAAVGFCNFWGFDVCANAANQVLNCVANGGCGDSGSAWQSQATDPNFTATSITSDTLGGWTNGPTNTAHFVGTWPYLMLVWDTTPGASVWANGFYEQVQWNGDSGSFSCETGVYDGTPTKDPN